MTLKANNAARTATKAVLAKADTMKAGVVVPEQAGGRVAIVVRPIPRIGDDEVLVKVAAAGVNRVDLFQRDGLYTPPPGVTDVLGVEISGTIVEVGAGVTNAKPGDLVCAIVIGGGYAEYCPVPSEQLLPVPKGFSLVEAGAIMETFSTVWSALMEHGRFAKGETVLIHGGSSGIGTTAIMLMRALGAGTIFTTAGTSAKCNACRDLGADRTINYREQDFEAVVARETGGRGVDIVLDMVAGDYVPKDIACLADDGRLVFVGRMSQKLDVTVNVNRIMYKRLIVTGLSIRGQPVATKGRIARALRETVWPLLEARTIAPVIDLVLPFERLHEAHERLLASTHIGKIVLTFGEASHNERNRP